MPFIAALYAIEEEIRGRSAGERRKVRTERSEPLLESMKNWFEESLGKLSRKSDITKAIRYALQRWDVLTRFCEDGRLEIDNNAAYAASGIGGVMPRVGLCRIRAWSGVFFVFPGGSLAPGDWESAIIRGSPGTQARGL